MEERNIIDNVIAVADILTPILIFIFSAVGWKFRQSIERRLKLEERLRDDRIQIYNQILEPFIIAFVTDAAWKKDPKNKKKDKDQVMTEIMLSLNYKRDSFKLSLIGSDAVVKAYNNLMQYFYKVEGNEGALSPVNIKKMANLLGSFLLAIRKSMGNESTKLKNLEMLEWFFKDIDEIRME